MNKIIVIAHNVRSAQNVGSLLRTAEGLAVNEVILSGYTPYPLSAGDIRMPHLAKKIHARIAKVSLGAEDLVTWQHIEDIKKYIDSLKKQNYSVVAVEQTRDSIDLSTFAPPDKLALIFGREVEGLEKEIIDQCDYTVEIPMLGKKESFNVVQAAAMVLYHCRYT
jgi:23S rRNA (guanosine2251-2'-O)-methyltransferase